LSKSFRVLADRLDGHSRVLAHLVANLPLDDTERQLMRLADVQCLIESLRVKQMSTEGEGEALCVLVVRVGALPRCHHLVSLSQLLDVLVVGRERTMRCNDGIADLLRQVRLLRERLAEVALHYLLHEGQKFRSKVV